MRWFASLTVLLVVCASSARAGEPALECGGLDPDSFARLMLEGGAPHHALLAQALHQADARTLAKVFEAVRRLAPIIDAERTAHGPTSVPRTEVAKSSRGARFEVRFLEAQPDLLQDLVVETDRSGPWQGNLDLRGPSTISFIDDTQRAVLLRAVAKLESVTQLAAPRITLLDRQRGSVATLRQRSLITDAAPIDPNNTKVGSTTNAEAIDDGLVLSLRPTLSADGRYITLELSLLSASTHDEPHARASASGESGLQIPKLCLRQTRSTIRIPDGGTVALSHAGAVGEPRRLTLIMANRVERVGGERSSESTDSP